jgi:hypothetical protein
MRIAGKVSSIQVLNNLTVDVICKLISKNMLRASKSANYSLLLPESR